MEASLSAASPVSVPAVSRGDGTDAATAAPRGGGILSLLTLGVGAGKTSTYDAECSSAFLLQLDGAPALLLDLGLGVTAAVLRHHRHLPRHVYVSHNHTDHAGELPVVLAVEAARQPDSSGSGAQSEDGPPPSERGPMTVLAEGRVMQRLKKHRLAELASTGRPLEHFGRFVDLEEGRSADLGAWGLAVAPLRVRHSELAFGLLITRHGVPVLGWTSDSGYCEELMSQLAAAPVVLVDAREHGAAEHAGFDEIAAAAASGLLRGTSVYIYGYGRVDEAPSPRSHPGLCSVAGVLRPGDTLCLGPRAAATRSDAASGGSSSTVSGAHRQD